MEILMVASSRCTFACLVSPVFCLCVPCPASSPSFIHNRMLYTLKRSIISVSPSLSLFDKRIIFWPFYTTQQLRCCSVSNCGFWSLTWTFNWNTPLQSKLWELPLKQSTLVLLAPHLRRESWLVQAVDTCFVSGFACFLVSLCVLPFLCHIHECYTCQSGASSLYLALSLFDKLCLYIVLYNVPALHLNVCKCMADKLDPSITQCMYTRLQSFPPASAKRVCTHTSSWGRRIQIAPGKRPPAAQGGNAIHHAIEHVTVLDDEEENIGSDLSLIDSLMSFIALHKLLKNMVGSFQWADIMSGIIIYHFISGCGQAFEPTTWKSVMFGYN